MNWDGFLMGISDFGLERLKEERQKKMQKDLLELQEQYKIDAEERAEKLQARKVHTSRETGDGLMQDVNVFGEDVGNPWEISAEERRARQRAEESHSDSMLTSASQRDYQTRSLDLRGQELAERRAAREAGMNNPPSLDGGEDLTNPVDDMASLILRRWGQEAPRAGNAESDAEWARTQALARAAATRAIQENNPSAAFEIFSHMKNNPVTGRTTGDFNSVNLNFR